MTKAKPAISPYGSEKTCIHSGGNNVICAPSENMAGRIIRRNCDNCDWNPAVASVRVALAKAKRQEEMRNAKR